MRFSFYTKVILAWQWFVHFIAMRIGVFAALWIYYSLYDTLHIVRHYIIQCTTTRAGDFLLSLMVLCCTTQGHVIGWWCWAYHYTCTQLPSPLSCCGRATPSTSIVKLICCAFSSFFPPYRILLVTLAIIDAKCRNF